MLLCEDVRFPEAGGVLAVRRADLIAIPTHWDGSYGGPLQESEGLFAQGFPANTMCLWYAVAKTGQAYTVVANAVGGGALGSSGVFTLNPVDAEAAGGGIRSTRPPLSAWMSSPGATRTGGWISTG